MIKLSYVLFGLLLTPLLILPSYQTNFDLGVVVSEPFMKINPNGTISLVGEVENKKNIPITNVKIKFDLYDNSVGPIESVVVDTVLDVIPSNSKSPYIIQSNLKQIQSTQSTILGFGAVVTKPQMLTLTLVDQFTDFNSAFKGIISNSGDVITTNVKIHLTSFDKSGIVINVETISLDAIEPNTNNAFEIYSEYDSSVSEFSLVAESFEYNSYTIRSNAIHPAAMADTVLVGSTLLYDLEENILILGKTNESIIVQNTLTPLESENHEIKYNYFIQVKRSGENPFVEHVGQSNGTIYGDEIIASAIWTPRAPDLYYIEVYVWDDNNIPIYSAISVSLVLIE